MGHFEELQAVVKEAAVGFVDAIKRRKTRPHSSTVHADA